MSSKLGEFMDQIETRLKDALPEQRAREVSFALFPLVLKMGIEMQDVSEDTREETLGWAVIALLEHIAKLKGQEPLFGSADADGEAS